MAHPPFSEGQDPTGRGCVIVYEERGDEVLGKADDVCDVVLKTVVQEES